MTQSRVEAALPLTPLQEGMLFHALYDDQGLDVYVVQFAFDLAGPLRPHLLRASADELVARHAVLRAGFLPRKTGEPVQLISRTVDLPWTDLDLSDLPPAEQQERLTRCRAEERVERFDMARPPLLRMTLVRLSDEHHVLIVTYHHILLDAWSLQLVLRDLLTLYAERADASALPPVVPFSHYLDWLGAQDREAAGRAWTAALAGLPEPTLVAGERSAEALAKVIPSLAATELSAELTAAVTRNARAAGLTVNTVVQGVWALLLSSMTGRQDVVFGQTVSGRPPELAGVEDIVGLLIGAAPVRVRMDPAESLAALLDRIQREQADLEPYHFLGLADIQRRMGLGDLYDTTVATVGAPLAWGEVCGPIDGLRVEVATEPETGSGEGTEQAGVQHYPLNLTVAAGPALRLALSYRPDLFDELAVDRLMARLRSLLQTYATAPQTPVGQVSLLSEDEFNQIVVKWNDTARSVPELTLPDLFEAQAARTPDAIAVIGDGQRLTYAQFGQRVDELASVLHAQGVRPGDFVAVALRRSVDLVVALHAVVAAGAAYVPVDPDYPTDRIGWILEDSTPALLLTTAQVDTELPPVPVRRLLLDDLPPAPAARPPRRLPAQSPAYVIFTSGSTGRPKGVVVPHASIVTNLRYMQDQFQLGTEDRVLLKTSASFDTSLWELFWAPQTGAAIVVATPDGHKDAAYLADLIQRESVTWAHFVPSMLTVFLQEPAATGCRSLRQVVTAGETLPEETRNRFFACLDARLHNMYGPTETTVVITHTECVPAGPDAPITIGKPIWNSQAYVLDGALRPVPVGVAGELYLGGQLVTAGYAGRPGLTAERFIANPYGEPGSRLYRSGDVVRWTADGDLEFIGRADGQIKLRGHRIELGEIEAVLARHETVAQVAVVVREDPSGAKRLVACVVAHPGVTLHQPDLIAHATAALPAYMVPTTLVELPEFPLTPNGKLDRKALSAPGVVAVVGGRKPRGATEELLAGLFTEVLRLDAEIGAEDNFFDLGGDSIMSIQLVARARRAGVVFTPKDVFTHRTVTALARVARTEQAPTGDTADAGLGELPATPIMHWLAEHHGPSDGFHQATLLRVPAALDAAQLTAAVQALLDRHDALRLRRTRQAGTAGWTLDVAPPGSVRAEDCVRRVDAAGLDETGLRALVLAESDRTRAALAPDERQVVRFVWFDTGPDAPGRLLAVAHHLAVDEVSWQILLPDLRQAWEAVRRGDAPELAPVPTSLRTWSQRLVAAASEQARSAELPLWTSMLEGGDVPLGTRPPDPDRDVHGTARALTYELPPEHTTPLLTTLPAAYHAGVEDVLLTALTLAVGAWRRERGQGTDPDGTGPAGTADRGRSILVDLEGHGRLEEIGEGLDLSRTVGWFTSLHPVRLHAGASDPDLGAALKGIKEQLRAIPDRGLGYGLLRRLNPHTAPVLAALPTPQLGFNYLGRVTAPGDADWQPAAESDALGAPADPGLSLPHTLEVTAATADGPGGPRLITSLTWAGELLTEDDVRGLGEAWLDALRALAAHAAEPGAGGLTPSDVLPARVGQQELDGLEATWAGQGLADVLPLTPMQEGLLFHARYDRAATDVYLVQLAVELTGAVDAAALRAASQSLVDRHASLRVAFTGTADGSPVQLVTERARAPWAELDLSGDDGADGVDGRLAAFLARDRERRFDPADAPLLRFALLRLGGERHTVVFTLHHILIDGWSIPLLLRDLFALYAQHTGGDAADLATPVPVRDYYAWLAGQDTAAAAAAWRTAFAGLTGPTLLAPGADAAALPTLPRRTTEELSPELTAALTRQARACGLTLNTVVQGAWALLLAGLTGRRDVVFGATVSVRPPELPGVEEMVGALLSTVPVRVRLDEGGTLAQLLARVQNERAQLTPYDHLGGAAVQRLAGLGPLFDASMVFQNYPDAESVATLPGTGLQVTGLHERDAYHYPLKLSAAPGDRLFMEISHRPELVPDATAELVVHRLTELLSAFADDPHRPVDGLLVDPLPGHRPATPHDPVGGLPADPAIGHRPAGARRIAALAAEVLGRPELDPDADFFAAGGDSLHALRLADRIGAECGRELPVGTVFRYRTATRIAAALD